MATKLLRTQKTYAAGHGETLYKTGETKEIVDVGPNKRLAEGKAATHRSTPPKESRSSGTRPDKTPSARAKVLPWVQGIESDVTAEGMFGPYASRPGSMIGPPVSRHPFAYSNAPMQPISFHGGVGVLGPDAGTKVLSRPAAAKAGEAAGSAGGAETPGGFSNTSPGMGTFGLDMEGTIKPAQVPLPKSRLATTAGPGAPRKTQYTTRKPVSERLGSPGPMPPPRSVRSYHEPPQTKPDSDEPLEELEEPTPHLHHPHHDYPFSHVNAQARQTEAMMEARAAALAQLEAAQYQQAELEIARERAALMADGFKGPRQTFETTTSVPSFGHIFHRDGMPLSARPSMQAPGGFDPVRIPFGVPMGMNIPRGLMVLGEGGMGVGLSLDPGLLDIAEEQEPRRGEDRSAFVETVEDEEDPTAGTASPPRNPTYAAQSNSQTMAAQTMQARTESGLFGHPAGMKESVRMSRQGSPAYHLHTQAPPAGSRAPTMLPSKALTANYAPTKAPSAPNAPSKAPTAVKAPSKAPTVVSERQTVITEPGRRTVYSQVRTKNTPTIIPHEELEEELPADGFVDGSVAPSHHDSAAPTTISNVKRMVAESRFHDDTLCQLLDAARLNLIGDEAKKALQRAARARVIELRDLRGADEGPEPEMPPLHRSTNSTPRKEKRAKSKDRHRRRSGSESKAKSEKAEVAESPEPPVWAQEIIARLSEFDARLAQLDRPRSVQGAEGTPSRPLTQHTHMSHNVPSTMIDELIFNELPSSGFTNGINMPQGLTSSILFPKGLSQAASHPEAAQSPPVGTIPSQYSQRAPTHITQQYRTVQTQQHSQPLQNDVTHGEPINWGSDVELPRAGDSVPPPKATTMAPTINILAPTESNIGPGSKSTRPASPSVVRSRASSRAAIERLPDEVEIKVITEEALPQPAMPDPRERDLPPPPSESIRSNRPTTPQASTPYEARTARAGGAAPSMGYAPTQVRGSQYPAHSGYMTNPYDYHPPPVESTTGRQPSPFAGAVAKPSSAILSQAPVEGTATPPRDKIHVVDPLFESTEGMQPWDVIQQRLYGWAIHVEEKSFVRALEDVSLGRQVESFPLSIFLMMTYKRLLRRNLSENPPVPCDKLFVPPHLADTINVSVHHRNYAQAKELLVALWNSLGNTEPPRVIVALTKVRDDPDQWSAHRYDLVSNHLSTYKVSHLQDPGVDGRPFHWWQVIRQAWPEHQIPSMEELERTGTGEKVINTRVMPEHRHDNSLYAANISRNLLLGYRPERDQDLTKLRELVWAEVKRLLSKKRQGKLAVVHDSPDHLYDT